MGKKKSTQLKPETKQLFDQHLGGSVGGPLFYIDHKSANSTESHSTPHSNATKLKFNGKRKRGQSNQDEDQKENANKKLKSKKSIASGSSSHKNEDTMDTSEDGVDDADAPFLHDSDDEVVGYVERNKYQRSAHKQKQSKLENEREVGRLKRATEIKAKKELAAAAANSPLFDLWATSLEDDLKAGIVPSKNEKGFRTGRTQQTRFRHEGKNRSTDHLTPSVLPKQIHEGASFHPDHAAHQELLRIAYEKDEAERTEQLAMRARFTSHLPQVDSSSVTASPPSGEDDSWIDAPEPIKGPTPSHLKYSTTQRNRMARAAENRAKQEAKAAEKELGKFVQRIPVLMAEWKKADKAAAKEKARIEELKKTQPDRKPKLGKYAEEEQFPDFALTEELPQDGSLRTLKPSSRIVEDQFVRFQQRHLIETRKRVKPTKAMKGRVYDRFKDDQPPTSQTSTTNQ